MTRTLGLHPPRRGAPRARLLGDPGEIERHVVAPAVLLESVAARARRDR